MSHWFRPPAQPATPNGRSPLAAHSRSRGTAVVLLLIIVATDLELYNIRTDAWGLLTIALLTLLVADAIPFLNIGSAGTSGAARRPYAKAMIWATIFHHVTTGMGAYQHWSRETHNTPAMAIGVYGNIFLTVLGLVALLTLGNGRATGAKRKV